MSETEQGNELKVLRALSSLSSRNEHLGSRHVNRMLDDFTIEGPNGRHSCLVLELVGSNVADFIDAHCCDDRLPPRLARVVAKQTMHGIDFLTSKGIGHGGMICDFHELSMTEH